MEGGGWNKVVQCSGERYSYGSVGRVTTLGPPPPPAGGPCAAQVQQQQQQQ